MGMIDLLYFIINHLPILFFDMSKFSLQGSLHSLYGSIGEGKKKSMHVIVTIGTSD